MSNLDGSGRDPDYRAAAQGGSRNTNTWIVTAAIAVLAILALGYLFGGNMMNNNGMMEHRATAPDQVQPTATPSTSTKP